MGDDGAIRVSDYCALLRDNPRFRYLFSAYLVTNSGNWINYVAALAFIRMLLGVGADGDEAGADGSAASAPEEAALSKAGVYTAAFMFIRMLPAIALAPCVGAIAERVDKRLGLFVCDMCAATCVGGMLLLSVGLDQGREGLDGQPGVLVWPAFFILVFLQQSCAAQYDPLRSSLVPQVCLGERELKIATTVDASVWSALMAIGGAIGGFVTTRFGITTNFAVDACSYLGSAMLTLLMSAPMKPPDAAKGADDDQPGTPMSRTGSEAEGGEPDAAARPRLPYHAPLGARLCDRLCFPQYVTPPPGGEEEGDNIQPIGLYLRENPGLLLMLFAKMSGALTWGLAELIEVELSALPSFQLRGSWGSPSATLGLVYAATGVGALLGPLVANSCGGEGSIYMGGSERRSQFIMVIGFAIGTAAYSMLLIGTHIDMDDGYALNVTLLCGAGFLRAVSSSLVWVYSTLVVQSMVLGPAGGNPWANPVFGRVFALEMSVFTTGKLGSFVLGGAGLGLFTCNAQCAATMLLVISAVATVVWAFLLLGSSCCCSGNSRNRTVRPADTGPRESLL